jgi:hypothetical protein
MRKDIHDSFRENFFLVLVTKHSFGHPRQSKVELYPRPSVLEIGFHYVAQPALELAM